MASHLVFSLAANIGSMGELAGNERRGSLAWPGRSAIIGLMAAAMGVRRDGDFSALDALTISVAVFDTGTPLRDFHTVQTIPSAKAKYPNSRPEALRTAKDVLNTAITLRDYRSGLLYGVVVSGEGLEPIAQSLRTPSFTLYLGRKSCPLAAPTGAKVVDANTIEEAVSHIDLPPWRAGATAHTLIVDTEQGETIRDVPLDRLRWHHAHRQIARLPLPTNKEN